MKLYGIYKGGLEERAVELEEIKSSFLADPLSASVKVDDANIGYIAYVKGFLSAEFQMSHLELTLDMMKQAWEWYRKYKEAMRISTVLGFQIA